MMTLSDVRTTGCTTDRSCPGSQSSSTLFFSARITVASRSKWLRYLGEWRGYRAPPRECRMRPSRSAGCPGRSEHLVERHRIEIPLLDDRLNLIEQRKDGRVVQVTQHDGPRLEILLRQTDELLGADDRGVAEASVPHEDARVPEAGGDIVDVTVVRAVRRAKPWSGGNPERPLDPLVVSIQLVGDLRTREANQIGVIPGVVADLNLTIGNHLLNTVRQRCPEGSEDPVRVERDVDPRGLGKLHVLDDAVAAVSVIDGKS